ncbi:MAG TPA: hypothetical protein VFT88_03555 [Acidobacteriaceae bacterium]|nr:hypothetical protein [Acidobacteriaceae bacterium]
MANLRVNFEQQRSQSQKWTAACDGFRSQIARGTSWHGACGFRSSNENTRPRLA